MNRRAQLLFLVDNRSTTFFTSTASDLAWAGLMAAMAYNACQRILLEGSLWLRATGHWIPVDGPRDRQEKIGKRSNHRKGHIGSLL